ncbi:MAG: glycosyltransferase family 4 protein [Solirubrobacteraceae bacterium]
MARVTFVIIDVGPVGGMERQATEVVRGLVEQGHEVTVVARTCELGDIRGVRFERISAPMRPFSLAFPIWVLLASLRVSRLRGDVVHVNGAIVLNRADITTIHFCHRAFQAGFKLAERSSSGVLNRINALAVSTMARWMETWCLRPGRVGQVVGISSGVAGEVDRWFPSLPGSPTVIPYGVDSVRFRPSAKERERVRGDLGLSSDVPLAVFVGGEWERKGLRFVIEAIRSQPRWHLAVAGVGDEHGYRGLAASSGAAGRVHFFGRVDPAGLYAAGDAFVFPTAYETFSLVVHEAAAAGLPLIVTRVSGPDELVEPGVNGWFVSRSVEEIGAKLAIIAADPELGRRMGKAARVSAAPLTWDRARAAHAELYATVLDRRRVLGASQ